ncbi:unknown [Prevotella sp. CAG:386]|nr:unknown [Prevotella sp. CAG:386]
MIIDQQHFLTLYRQTESRTQVAFRGIGNQFLAQYRELAQHHQAVTAIRVIDGFDIRINRTQQRVYLFPLVSGRDSFLKTHNICILPAHIPHYRIDTVLIRHAFCKAQRIIRQYFDRTSRRFATDIQGHVFPYRHITQQKAQKRNKSISRLDNQPEEQKAEIDEKEKGKEQSGSRQQCKMLWRQMVRVSYSHHQNDRSDIGACYHPYGEILDSVKHFPNLFLT